MKFRSWLYVGLLIVLFILPFTPGQAIGQDVVLFEHVLYEGHDPLTPPQTRFDFVSSGIYGLSAPRVQCRYMHARLTIKITGSNLDNVNAATRQCLDEALKAGLATGIITAFFSGGGALSAAKAAFTNYLLVSLTQRLPMNLIPTVSVENPTFWGDWGGC